MADKGKAKAEGWWMTSDDISEQVDNRRAVALQERNDDSANDAKGEGLVTLLDQGVLERKSPAFRKSSPFVGTCSAPSQRWNGGLQVHGKSLLRWSGCRVPAGRSRPTPQNFQQLPDVQAKMPKKYRTPGKGEVSTYQGHEPSHDITSLRFREPSTAFGCFWLLRSAKELESSQ